MGCRLLISLSSFVFDLWSFARNLGEGEVKEGTNWNSFTLDLFEKMPYHSLAKEERKELWDDGLHFTTAGYAKIGSLVAERLIEIMEEARAGKE